MHPDVAKARSRSAVAHRRGNPEQITEAKRDLAAAKLRDYVSRVVDAAPPLTEAQRADIAALLLNGGRSA